jgi:hypothetical protein
VARCAPLGEAIERKEDPMEPEDLITRAEREAGCRWDDPSNPAALAILLGSVAREIGKTPASYTERDDFAVGMWFLLQQEGRAQDISALLLALIQMGIDPKTIADMFGAR